MRSALTKIAPLILLLISPPLFCKVHRYGEHLCQLPDYSCLTIHKGETWEGLFPNEREQDLVKRLNRMNIELKKGMIIAVPNNIDDLTVRNISPLPQYIDPIGEKLIYISQEKLAFGAYDKEGELLWWGPISSGIGPCNGLSDDEMDESCNTPTGSFRIIRKQEAECISTVFPRRSNGENGGALMPYCMHFLRGYALHGSFEVPGYRASHGCVRLFVEDARWLNEEFIDLPGKGMSGTRVVIDNSEE